MGANLPEVLLLTVDAGGGHRAAASALVAAAEIEKRGFSVHALSLQEVFRSLDTVRRLTGASTESLYNFLQRRRLTATMGPLLRLLHFGVWLKGRGLRREAARLLERRRPAAVVSVVPNFNAVVRDAVRSVLPQAPFVVVLTDFADLPPHFWVEPGIDHVVVGSDRAARQAAGLGLPEDRVTRASGMVLHPRFYPKAGPDARSRVRREFGFGDRDFVTLVVFGGKGSPEVAPLASALLREAPTTRTIAVCGQNPELTEKVGRLERSSDGRLRCLGFSDRLPELLAAADVLCTKPGPGSIAEALHQEVPVIVPRNWQTIPQERYNTELVAELGVGLVVSHWREMPARVVSLAQNREMHEGLRANAAALPPNRAVWEVLELLARLVPLEG